MEQVATRPGGGTAGSTARRAALATVAVVVAGNVAALPAWRDGPLYVPIGLAFAAAVVMAGRRAGLGAHDLGATQGQTARGATWGWVAAVAVGLGWILPLLDNESMELVTDRRYVGMSGAALAYHVLVRVPLGTALVNEVVFRGVLAAWWRRSGGRRVATLATSLAFGLWHVVPAMAMLDANRAFRDGWPTGVGVAVACAVMALVGWGLAWLRWASASLVAPWMAAWALGAFGTLSAVVALRP